MNNRIILVGPGCSGKDTLMERMKNKGMKATISCTTRPKRDNEINGVHYNFLDYLTFQQMILDKKFWQWKVFNQKVEDKDSWYYGTTWESWQHDEIFILTPPAIKDDISSEDRKTSFIIYINISREIRKLRLLERQDADTVERRLFADDMLFKDFGPEYYDLMITDPLF